MSLLSIAIKAALPVYVSLDLEESEYLTSKMISEVTKNIILTITSFANPCINGVMIVVLVKSNEIWEEATTPLLTSLCISDILLFVLFSFISNILVWIDATADVIPLVVMKIHAFGLIFPRLSSLGLAAALALVKLITIMKPLRAQELLSPFRLKVILAVTWIVPTLITLPVFFFPVKYDYNMKTSQTGDSVNRIFTLIFISVSAAPSIIILFVSYITIFLVVVKKKLQSRRLVGIAPEEAGVQNNEIKAVLHAFKSAKAIVALLTVYIVLYLPTLIIGAFHWGSPDEEFIIYTSSFCVSFLNSLTYMLCSKKARTSIRKILFTCRRNTVGPGSSGS